MPDLHFYVAHPLLALALLLAAPFWATKAPADWSREELNRMFSDSPWAQITTFENRFGGVPGVQVYLATSRPMQEAEEQAKLQEKKRGNTEPEAAEEYREFLRASAGKNIVLAVRFPDPTALADGAEARKMEEECVLKVGRKKFKMTGHFPPAASDPYLRLVYPRVVEPTDREFVFELYVPGVAAPYRQATFRVKDLYYKGKLEM